MLSKTVESFACIDYNLGKLEIIVVDNNSSDLTHSVVQKDILKYDKVQIKYIIEKRQGVHYARNSGAKLAQYETLYFTDDDMIADSSVLNYLSYLFKIDDNIAVCTGKVVPIWEGNVPKFVLKHCNNYILSLTDEKSDIIVANKLDYIFSCHQAIKKNVFFEVEGFNPEYTFNQYMGDGESGLNLKIQNKGYKFAYSCKSIVYHQITKNRYKLNYLTSRFENNGRAHAYTVFNLKNSIPLLYLRIVRHLFFDYPIDLVNSLFKIIRFRDFELFRFFIAINFYWKGRILFSSKILLNNNFKKFVLKNDWLSNDSEFDDCSEIL